MNGSRYIVGETFEQMRARCEEQERTGRALAAARFERGVRLTEAERDALRHDSRFGSDGYPVRKLGRGYVYEHAAASSPSICKTKREAIIGWEIKLAIYRAQHALEAGIGGAL